MPKRATDVHIALIISLIFFWPDISQLAAMPGFLTSELWSTVLRQIHITLRPIQQPSFPRATFVEQDAVLRRNCLVINLLEVVV